jgi:mannose-6-phosphate isomerase-like protein (cupin superfamily)
VDTASFEAELKRAGYDETKTAGFAAGHDIGTHSHPYDVRALVLEGEFTIAVDGVARTYAPGDVFVLAGNTPHTERVGPVGVKFLIGRRHGAGAQSLPTAP